MNIRFFAVAKDGTRTEITDLYWFEENAVHSLNGVAVDGSRVAVVIPQVIDLAALDAWLEDRQEGESLIDCVIRHIQRARDSAARQAAEPLVALLREARRSHSATYLSEENDHEPCPKHYDKDATECTCGADAWNARVDAALEGMQ